MNSPLLITVLFWTLGATLVCVSTSISSHPKLLLVVYDGFKNKYLELVNETSAPNLYYFIKHGARPEYLRPVNPTITYANHMSLLTGLNAESHGIVSNSFFDPLLNDSFQGLSLSNDHVEDNFKTKFFDVGSEPIWVTNQNAASSRLTGSVMFPCTMVPVKWVAVTNRADLTWRDQEVVLPYEKRVDAMIEWFTRKINPINLGLLYFDNPDESGHAFGPDSEKMKEIILGKMEYITGYLLQKFKEHDLLDSVNIILAADHGMTQTPHNQTVNIDLHVNTTWFDASFLPSVWPLDGHEDDIYERLKNVPHLHIHKKSDKELVSRNVSHNRRIGPLYMWLDNGYKLINNATNKSLLRYGNHGYDNTEPDMHAMFIGLGPVFKSGFHGPPMDTIDVYELMCYILGVTPAPNNGTFDHGRMLLKDEGGMDNSMITLVTFLVCAVLGALVAGVFCISLFRMKQNQNRMVLLPIDSNSPLHTNSRQGLLKSEDEDDDEF